MYGSIRLNLIFSEKKFRYTQSIPNPGESNLEQLQKVESIVMSFPLQVRLKSDRIKNFRVYSLAGIKYDFDLASNAGARNSENIVKVKKSDFGVETGIGFQFFFKYFIFRRRSNSAMVLAICTHAMNLSSTQMLSTKCIRG